MNPLDNPIWASLTTRHAHLAVGDDLARRYPPEIGPLSGLEVLTPQAVASLRELTRPGGAVALFLLEPPGPLEGWMSIRNGPMDQMIWEGRDLPEAAPVTLGELRPLTVADVQAMIQLARLTEPGPFEQRTCELGRFFGVFEDGRLLAMAGERQRMPGYAEISAVCTHPDARGRGYARRLMLEVMAGIVQNGETPILHTLSSNSGAIRVYEALGFRLRRRMHYEVLQRADG